MVKSLSSNINITISKYIVEPQKTPKKWVKKNILLDRLPNLEYTYCVDPAEISKQLLSQTNTVMAKVIAKKHPDKIYKNWLSLNSSKWAYKLARKENLSWDWLSTNPSKWACKMFKTRPNKDCFHWLSENTSRWACKLFKTRPEKINWELLSANPSRWARTMLKPDKMNYKSLSRNPSDWACKILKTVPEKIDYSGIIKNTSRWAGKIYNKKSINCWLSDNPSKWTYDILKTKKEFIDWEYFSANPHILKIVKNNKYNILFDNLLNKII